MSVISGAVGMAAAGSIGLMASQGSVMAWNGDPRFGLSQQDLMYRQTFTGDSIVIDPPPNGGWYVQPNTLRPTYPQTFQPAVVGPGIYPNTMTDEEIAAQQRALEELRRYFETHPLVPQQPVVAAPPAPAPEPEGVSTEDSFRPQRKLDLD